MLVEGKELICSKCSFRQAIPAKKKKKLICFEIRCGGYSATILLLGIVVTQM